MCNIAVHAAFTIGAMHATYKRMMEAAQKTLGIRSPSKMAMELNVAPARFTNWKTRGIPENMYLHVARKVRCNPFWLETGEGEMLTMVQPVKEYGTAPGTPEHQVLKLMENMDTATKYKLIKIGDTLAEPDANGNNGPSQQAK